MSGHRRHQPSRQMPPCPTIRKYLPEVTQPTGQCGTRYPKKRLQPLNRVTLSPTLAQCRDYQHNRCPINASPPKQYRWRQHPSPATHMSATQTQANGVSLIKVRGAAPRLTQIFSVMQRPPAVGQGRARALSARSTSILCRRAKSDLRWRISGDIMTPAFVVGRSPVNNSAKKSEGLLFSFPHISCPI